MNFCFKNLFANPRKFLKFIIFFTLCGIAVFAVVTAFGYADLIRDGRKLKSYSTRNYMSYITGHTSGSWCLGTPSWPDLNRGQTSHREDLSSFLSVAN